MAEQYYSPANEWTWVIPELTDKPLMVQDFKDFIDSMPVYPPAP